MNSSLGTLRGQAAMGGSDLHRSHSRTRDAKFTSIHFSQIARGSTFGLSICLDSDCVVYTMPCLSTPDKHEILELVVKRFSSNTISLVGTTLTKL